MNEFVNPKSMATPGAAGALIMLVTNALCHSFPEFSPRFLALGLSFAAGAIVLSAVQMKFLERGAYWVINSLIIFSVGFGTANFAQSTAALPVDKVSERLADIQLPSALFAVFSAAYAQTREEESAAALRLQVRRLETKLAQLEATKQQAQQESTEEHQARLRLEQQRKAEKEKAERANREAFFKRW